MRASWKPLSLLAKNPILISLKPFKTAVHVHMHDYWRVAHETTIVLYPSPYVIFIKGNSLTSRISSAVCTRRSASMVLYFWLR